MTTNGQRPPVVIKMHVEGFGDSRDETLVIDRSEWDSMTPDRRVKVAEDCANEFAANYVSWGWHIDDPLDYASTEETPHTP